MVLIVFTTIENDIYFAFKSKVLHFYDTIFAKIFQNTNEVEKNRKKILKIQMKLKRIEKFLQKFENTNEFEKILW